MAGTVIEERVATKHEQWKGRIAEQERSGVSVKQFCAEQGVTECTFYAWRKRLRGQEPVRFALVDRGSVPQGPAMEASLELVLATGERLRIGAGVEAASLRIVLEALRA